MESHMLIPRSLAPLVAEKLTESKILVLRGPRKSGKKTLISEVLYNSKQTAITIDCTDKKQRKAVAETTLFREYVAGNAVVVLDEAQLLVNLQEIIDHALNDDRIDNLILCCSFEPVLQEELWEALRFQGLELQLSPLSYTEMAQAHGLGSEEKQLEQRLIFGYYPEIVSHPEQAESRLLQLLEDSIFTQLGAADRINKSEQLIQLLRLLAFHIGEAISYNELAQQCGIDNETAERYIKLLEKAHLLFLLPCFYNGNRYELKKSHIVYFTDNGIRNALIRQFQPLVFRNDTDLLWKNWVIAERRKANILAGRTPDCYFWKTHTKQEMDYIEGNDSGRAAYKMQWDKKRQIKIPASFTEAYPEIKTGGINRSTFWSLITKK